MKLARRINRICAPKGMRGYLALAVRRRRLIRALRLRFEVPYAIFAAQISKHEKKQSYDPLNDYGFGRATTPTSIGGGLVKSIIGTLRR